MTGAPKVSVSMSSDTTACTSPDIVRETRTARATTPYTRMEETNLI